MQFKYKNFYTVEQAPKMIFFEKANIFQLLQDRSSVTGSDSELIKYKDKKGSWNSVTVYEFQEHVKSLAKGLMALGIKKGDRIAILSKTSYEWISLDFACFAAGIVVVPIYETSSAEQICKYVNITEPKLIFAQDDSQKSKIAVNHDRYKNFDADKGVFVLNNNDLDVVISYGNSISDDEFYERATSVTREDLATIVFTSGSTGRASGVELTHGEMIERVLSCLRTAPESLLKKSGMVLLFLPMAHIFARFIVLDAVAGTSTLAVTSDIPHLIEDMKIINPTFFVAVPRIFEKVFNAATQKAGIGFKAKVFRHSVAVALRYSFALDKKLDKQAGKKPVELDDLSKDDSAKTAEVTKASEKAGAKADAAEKGEPGAKTDISAKADAVDKKDSGDTENYENSNMLMSLSNQLKKNLSPDKVKELLTNISNVFEKEDEYKKSKMSLKLRIQHKFYDILVYSNLRAVFGKNYDSAFCGGAPFSTSLAHFFRGAGVNIIEGYGLTESIGAVILNAPSIRNKIGTIGKVMVGNEAKIDETGELLLKSPGLFKGYYKDEEATKAVWTEDGWFKTGDIATVDEDGYYKITGRKKNLIITAGGKNVNPEPAEIEIEKCPFVEKAVVIGDGKPFVSALITLNEDALKHWCSQNNIIGVTQENACENKAVQYEISRAVDMANRNVSRAESVRKFAVLKDNFSEKDGTLTASSKIVRGEIVKHYAEDIAGIYSSKK